MTLRYTIKEDQATNESRNLFTEETEIATRGWIHGKRDKDETRICAKDHCQNVVPQRDLLNVPSRYFLVIFLDYGTRRYSGCRKCSRNWREIVDILNSYNFVEKKKTVQ